MNGLDSVLLKVSTGLQWPLIDTSKELGIPTKNKGVCFGVSALAALSFVESEDAWLNYIVRLAAIVERFNLMITIISSGFSKVTKEKIKELNIRELTEEDKDFLILLNLLQSPTNFRHFGGALAPYRHSDAAWSQYDFFNKWIHLSLEDVKHGSMTACLSLEAIRYRLNLDKTKKCYIPESIGRYTQEEVKIFFQTLEEKRGGAKFSILLSSTQHAISVLHEPTAEKKWILVDANQGIFPSRDLESIVGDVIKVFSHDYSSGPLILYSMFISDPRAPNLFDAEIIQELIKNHSYDVLTFFSNLIKDFLQKKKEEELFIREERLFSPQPLDLD